MSSEQVKVGDWIYFQKRTAGLFKEQVQKITPTGLIKTSSYTMNPDLRIRGRYGYSGPFLGELETPDLIKRGELAEARQMVRSCVDGLSIKSMSLKECKKLTDCFSEMWVAK